MTPITALGGHHHVEDVMGMAVSIDLRDETIDSSVIDDVVRWLHHVDDTFSTYKDESPISRMGRGELAFVDADDEIKDVLRACEALQFETDGAFDVFVVPAPNGTTFDPSGYVKGWSVQRAATLLDERGCRNFCINAGGDIAVRGAATPAIGWTIGIRHPDDAMALATTICSDGPLAIATSATYQRGAHIIDPHTGQPTTGLASATVVGPDLAVADAYATALFVMGVDGLDWLRTRRGYDGYVITHDARTQWTPGFERYRTSIG